MANPWDFSTPVWLTECQDYPTFEGSVCVSPLPSDYCPYVSAGQVRKMVSTVSGLGHFEGESIMAQMDGDIPRDADGNEASNNFLVTGGVINFSKKAAIIHAGLGYIGLIRFLKSSDGSQIGTGQFKMRRLYLAALRIYKTAGIKIGIDENSLDPLLDSDETGLISGDREKLPNTTWAKDVEFVIKQDKPLPAEILAVLFRAEVEEKL